MLRNPYDREGRRPTEDKFGDPARDRSRSPSRERYQTEYSSEVGHRRTERVAFDPSDFRWRNEGGSRGSMFAGIKFHFHSHSSDPASLAFSMKYSRKLLQLGAKGCADMNAADLIIVIPDDDRLDLTIPGGRRCTGKNHQLDWMGVCRRFATRVDPMSDDNRRARKRVLQLNWVKACLQANRVLSGIDSDPYEIKVDNMFTQDNQNLPDRHEASQAQFGAANTGPLTIHCTVPSFEYRPDMPPSSPLQPSRNGQDDARPSSRDTQTECSTPSVPVLPAAVVPSSRPPTHVVASSRSLNHQERSAPALAACRPPTPPLPVVSLPFPVPVTEPSFPHRDIVVDTLTDAPSSLSRPLTQQRAPSPTIGPTVFDAVAATTKSSTPIPLSRRAISESYGSVSRQTPCQTPIPTQHNYQGVFARDQVLPWTFHVIDAERHRLAVMNITHFGGGIIVPLARAAIVVIPESGVREANTPELRDLVDSVGDGRAVVSIDWITQCIQEDQRVDLAPYRITYESEGHEVDIKMEEDAGTIPGSAPPTNTRWQATETAPFESLTRKVSTQPPQASVRAGIEHFVKEEITEEPMEEPVIEEMVNTDLLEDDDDDEDFFMILDHIPPVKKIIRRTFERDAFPTPPRTPATESTRFASPSYSEPLTSIGEADYEEDIPKSTRTVAVKDPRQTQPTFPMITDPQQQSQVVDTPVAPDDKIPFEELKERLQQWSSEGFPGTQKKFLADLCKEKPQSAWGSIYRIYKTEYYRTVEGLFYQGKPESRGSKRLVTTGQTTNRKIASRGKTTTSKKNPSKAPEQELASMFVPTTK